MLLTPWILILVTLTLFSTSIFALCIVLLHRLIHPGRDPVHIILAICILITLAAVFTFIVGSISIRMVRTKRWNAPAVTNFFIFRMLFFLVAFIAAWLTYKAVKTEGHQLALRWAFILENTMLLSIVLTLFVLYDHLIAK